MTILSGDIKFAASKVMDDVPEGGGGPTDTIITDGTTGYTAGYDTSDWAGFVTRNDLDLNTAARLGIIWDAGCKLTGGACASTATTGLTPRDPAEPNRC